MDFHRDQRVLLRDIDKRAYFYLSGTPPEAFKHFFNYRLSAAQSQVFCSEPSGISLEIRKKMVNYVDSSSELRLPSRISIFLLA
jgi:hypothetical protein